MDPHEARPAVPVDAANAWHDDDGGVILSLRSDGAWLQFRLPVLLAGDVAAHLHILADKPHGG